MSEYIQYDPSKHKGVPLYEIQSEEVGDSIIASVAVKSDISHELAAKMPWYYIVRKEDIIKKKQLIIIKGSWRSGNWGHTGKAGMHGGSDSGGGHAAVPASKLPGGKQKKLPFKSPKKKAPEKVATDGKRKITSGDKVYTADALVAAKKRLVKAQELEKVSTPLVSGAVKDKGGELHGLKYRLKTDESLAQKITLDVEEKGISEQQAADGISDAVRYTMIFGKEEFVSMVGETQTLLAEKGWTKYDNKYKNFFAGGDAYDGYNTVVENKATGQRFELQFHTPASIKIKETVHPWYKEFQTLPEGSPRRLELFNKMKKEWEGYERPVNWENLAGVRIG